MSAKHAYLGLDIGGTGAKAGVFDAAGAQLGRGHCPFTPRSPEPGHVEIEIEEIYQAARTAVAQALSMAHRPVAAMTIVSQGETFVSLDEEDQPLHPAIIWYDSRASEQARRLQEALQLHPGQEIPSAIEAICSAPKIIWLREHALKIMRRARRYLLLPDYLAYRLTGQAVIDPSTAASTGLYVDGAATYSRAALQASGIAEDQLARIGAPGERVGKLLPEMAREWGLSPETELFVGTNDQYAGAIGAGNCRPGILSETSGTCLALVTLTEKLPEPVPPGLFGGYFPIKPYFFALAYAKTAGVVLDWFRKECAGGADFETLNAEAAKVPIGCRGVTMLPHFDGLISPTPDAAMRGLFANLTLQHTRADLYRSILEALAFSLRENLELLRGNGLTIETVRCIGGGAKNDLWLQMKADVIGMAVEKPAVTEASMLGAAMLAAWGAGAFPSLAATSAACYHAELVFSPNENSRRQYEAPYRRYRELTMKALAR
ncbi:MAG: hypothetical protein HYV35_10370 [Lentisphaerae bacterium]|nr:hypothetical protein [Lentisphaerota bacterium]